MIDIGINLTNKQFKGKERAVLDRAKDAGLEKIILTGTSIEGSRQSLALARRFDKMLYTTAGVHPHNADSYTDESHAQLRTLLAAEEVIAVGECGLDFDRNFSSKDTQFNAFERQIELAKELDMPLFLHERSAHADFKAIMKNHQSIIPKSVVHCFTSNRYNLMNYLNMGFHIGITGWLCDSRRGKELQDAIKYLPLDRLMIETDAPFLMPHNINPRPNTRTNEPMYLPYVVKKLAELYHVSEDKIIEQTVANTKQFFGI